VAPASRRGHGATWCPAAVSSAAWPRSGRWGPRRYPRNGTPRRRDAGTGGWCRLAAIRQGTAPRPAVRPCRVHGRCGRCPRHREVAAWPRSGRDWPSPPTDGPERRDVGTGPRSRSQTVAAWPRSGRLMADDAHAPPPSSRRGHGAIWWAAIWLVMAPVPRRTVPASRRGHGAMLVTITAVPLAALAAIRQGMAVDARGRTPRRRDVGTGRRDQG
jgi:hypothetical protein